MAEQALYVPHGLGVVIGSRDARPWLARNAEAAMTPTWRGQPVFAAATDAFAWLDWARQQPWLPNGLAIAHVDVNTDVTAEGIHRIHIGPRQLREASNQILRAHAAAAGPDEQILAACHGIARVDAARVWLIDQAGATAHVRSGAAMAVVWEYGYRVAARDARTALAGQVERTVRAAQADPAARAPGGEAGRDELTRLDAAASTLAAGAALIDVLGPPPSVLDEARAALRGGGELNGWDDAMAVVWKHALRNGALQAVLGAATDIATLWRAGPRATTPEAARIQAQPADRWVAAMLLDGNRAVATQWLLATAQSLPAATPHPHTGAAPTPAAVEQPSRDDAAGPAGMPASVAGHPGAGRAFAAPPTAGSATAPPAAMEAAPPSTPSKGRRR